MRQEFSIFIDNEWKLLDPPQHSIAMNFQVNTLAEFKDRNASYSQAISLPRSAKNELVLGVKSQIGVSDSLPYHNYPCTLLIDGLRVTPPGAVLKLTSIKPHSIECQVLGGNADLVETLKTRTMSTLKSDGFGMQWMNSSIVAEGKLPNGIRYIWGYCNLIKNLRTKIDAGAPDGYINSPDRVYPMLNFGDLVKWILSKEGYSLIIEKGPTEARIGEVEYIPAIAPKCIQWTEPSITFAAVGEGVANTGNIVWRRRTTPILGMWGGIGESTLSYYATWSGQVSLKLSYQIRTGSATLNITKNNISGGTATSVVTDHVITSTSQETFKIDMEAGDYLAIRLVQSVTTDPPVSATASLTTSFPEETDGISVGAWYDLLASLGFSSRADLIQEFLRIYGLTMDIDAEKKEVKMYTLASVIAKEGDGSLDWSSKLVPGQEELTFQLSGYAQKNTIGFKKDDTNGISDEVTFYIYDSNLEALKTLWTSKFLSLTDVKNRIGEHLTVNIPVYEVDRSGEDQDHYTLKYAPTGDPVLLHGPGTAFHRLLTQGYPAVIQQTKSVPLSSPTRFKIQDMTPFYSPLWNRIAFHTKVLQATFNLTPVDIEMLDLSAPVWLGQYGSYFYISKVVNYTPNKLTKVNLIRL